MESEKHEGCLIACHGDAKARQRYSSTHTQPLHKVLNGQCYNPATLALGRTVGIHCTRNHEQEVLAQT